MDFATFIGIISAFGLIIGAIITGSGLSIFINVPSILIVLGGTIGATLINYTFSEIISVIRILKNVFLTKTDDYFEKLSFLIAMAVKARRDGVLALESEISKINDSFLKKGFTMVVDGAPEETIKEILSNEIYFSGERHKFGYEIFNSMGVYSPAMGLIGTLIGLVQMLQQLNNPKNIGPAMAVALITTFYGAILSNLIFLPLGGKLKRKSERELLFKEICIDGIVSIAKGENPRILEHRLMSFFTEKEKASFLEE